MHSISTNNNIVLTLLYFIYYSAIITKEVYSWKGKPQDSSETFDFTDMAGQIESVSVNESKYGFYLGDTETEERDYEEETSDVTDKMPTLPEESATRPDLPSEAQQHAETAEAQMEDIEPEYTDEFEPDEFDAILLNPANTVPVIITTDTRDKL